MKKSVALIMCLAVFALAAPAQTADVKINFDERFFDALLEAVFTKLEAPSVRISSSAEGSPKSQRSGFDLAAPVSRGPAPSQGNDSSECNESVTLRPMVDGVRTAVRFRQGKIYAPIAFSGTYNPPLIGCIEFQGWAETNIEIGFDRARNALVGNARVLNVNLSGTEGIGSSLIAKIVQGSIDKKINPIEIVDLERLSLTFPIKNSGTLRMAARDVKTIVNDGSIDVIVTYEFLKAK